MQPAASSELARKRMVRQARRDTAPELALRKEIWRSGLRYRIDAAPLPGVRRRADLLFTRARIAVYVDGCFWHSCPRHGTTPKANRDWWIAKLAANAERDRDTDQRLKSAGWRVIRVWEHEDPRTAARKIVAAVKMEDSRRDGVLVRGRTRPKDSVGHNSAGPHQHPDAQCGKDSCGPAR